MNRDRIYDAWAPSRRDWSSWAKPVLFATLDRVTAIPPQSPLPLLDVAWAPNVASRTAIVVDLPADQGVWTGLALAFAGYAPIPLYNALAGPKGTAEAFEESSQYNAAVDVRPIIRALVAAAPAIEKLELPVDAPPAFLLDANRRGDAKPLPESFDNRSISLPTDFPSANHLVSHGIQQVLLVQAEREEPQPDLAHTLRRWQEAGIGISAKSLLNDVPPQHIQVSRPSNFRLLWCNFLAAFGLRHSPLGGFGGVLPLPGGYLG